MSSTVFTGAATAIITPFTADGVDYETFGRLIDFQIEKGINAIVAAGTTGEGSTLTDREHEEVIAFCVKRIAGRVPLIAGTGSNNTAHAIERTKTACSAGADAVLLVTPYYNKTTQRGLVASFAAIADASSVPCILYNVPSRTGLNMLPETLFRLRRPDCADAEPRRQRCYFRYIQYDARGDRGNLRALLPGRRAGGGGAAAADAAADEPADD